MLANRLSARSAKQVLLIEAGPDTPPEDVPEVISSSYTGFSYFDPRYHWTELRIFHESLSENERRPRPRKFEQAKPVLRWAGMSPFHFNGAREMTMGFKKSPST